MSNDKEIKEFDVSERDFVFDTSTRTIVDYVGKEIEVIIPQMIGGIEVKVIGNKAFIEKGIVSVIIPNGVTVIDDAAFDGNELTSINIPNSVEMIGEYAFFGNNLTQVTIPNSSTTICCYAFEKGVEIIR